MTDVLANENAQAEQTPTERKNVGIGQSAPGMKSKLQIDAELEEEEYERRKENLRRLGLSANQEDDDLLIPPTINWAEDAEPCRGCADDRQVIRDLYPLCQT